jgi:hypothetical protein
MSTRLLAALATCSIGLQPMSALAFDGEVAWATRLNPLVNELKASVVQDDGKLLLVSTVDTSNETCPSREATRVTRLDVNGLPDPQFGIIFTPGQTLVSGPCGEDLIMSAVTVDGEGRIVLAGARVSAAGTSNAIVIRLLPNGAVDPGFGVDGNAEFERSPSQSPRDSATAVSVERMPPFRIFVGGRYENLTPPTKAVMFYGVDTNGIHTSWGANTDPNGRRLQIETFSRPSFQCTAGLSALDVRVSTQSVLAVVLPRCAQSALPVSDTPFVLRMSRTTSAIPAARTPVSFSPLVVPDSDGHLPRGHRIFDMASKIDPSSGRMWIAATFSSTSPAVLGMGVAAFTSQALLDTSVLAGQGRGTLRLPSHGVSALAVQWDGKLVIGGTSPDLREVRVSRLLPGPAAFDLGFGPDGSGEAGWTIVTVPSDEAASVLDLHAVPSSNDTVSTGVTEGVTFPRQFAIRMRSFSTVISRDSFEVRP